MSFAKIVMFLLAYAISFVTLYFIIKKSNLGEWIYKKNMRKIIGLIISFMIYMSGCTIIDNFNIVGNYYYILKGMLFSVVVIVSFIIPKGPENKKKNL